MSNVDFKMPDSVAENREQFQKLFYNIRKNDWFANCKGFAYLHILVKDLDELILNTPNMWSEECEDLKIEIAQVIKHAFDCGIDRAYAILHRAYVPTEEEYDYLVSKEFGEASDEPIEWGKYTSLSEAENGWFHFCLDKWNAWHDQHGMVDEEDKSTKKLMKDFRKSIEDEWKALSPAEQEGWKRV